MNTRLKLSFWILAVAAMITVSAFDSGSLSAQEFKVGDKVEFERLGKKYQGEVKSFDAKGQSYTIAYKDGPRSLTISLRSSRFQKMAQKSATQDSASQGGKSAGAKTAEMRLWTDTSGKFKVMAKLTDRIDDLIRLETEDGRVISVPVERLSAFDKKYLESVKPEMELTPRITSVEPVDSKSSTDSSAGSTAKSNSDSAKEPENKSGLAMNTVTPNLSAGKKLILISSGDWSVTPDAEVSVDVQSQAFEYGHSGFEKPIHNRLKNFVISPDGKYAGVSIHNSFGGDVTGIQFFDVSSGKQISSVGVPVKNLMLAGMIMDPPTFATTRGSRHKENGRIDFWDGSDGLKHVIGWEADYEHAKLLNNRQLLTIDKKGQAVVWDWKSGKAEYYFQAHAHAAPALSANQKQMAVAVQTGIMIIDVATGKPLGTLSTKERVGFIAFSRDGKKLASAQNGKLGIWDLSNGNLIDLFSLSGIGPFSPSLAWVDDENILVDSSMLVNYRLRVPIWKYNIKSRAYALLRGKGDKFWYAVRGDNGTGTFIPVKIPQKDVVAIASNYDPEDFLVIKPGMKVSIRMSLPFGQPDQQKIYDSLAKKLEANGCKVDPNSPIVLNCYTERGKTQTREYQNRGGFGRPFGGGSEKVTFTPTYCYIQIAKGNDVYWKRSVSSGPGFMMMLNEGESIQQAANNRSKPSPNFFMMAQIPKLFARLPAGKRSLGESELTENGIR